MRAAAGGILATALAVYVGRSSDDAAFLVGMLSIALFAATMVYTPLWGALGDLTARYRRLLVAIAAATVVLPPGFAPLLLSVVRAGALAAVAAAVVALALPEADPPPGDRPSVARRVETPLGVHHPTPGDPADDWQGPSGPSTARRLSDSRHNG